MTTLVKRKLQSLSILWLCTRLIFFVVVVGWYILVDYKVRLLKSHDSSPIKGTLCPVLKFCVSSIFPRDAIHRSQPLLALLQHLQGLKNKKSSSLGVSSTIYVLRWSYSFGSLFLVFWWCRVPNSLFFLLKSICAVPIIRTPRTGCIFGHTIATFSIMWHLFILNIYIFQIPRCFA